MSYIYLGLTVLTAYVVQYGYTVPVFESTVAKTANESADGNFCEVYVTDQEMEEALSKTQQFLIDQMDIISLSLTNASSMIPKSYQPETGEYLFFRYAIVNKKGQAILKFPYYADFLSSSILSAYKTSLSVNLVLSSTCNLTKEGFRAQVSQIAFNILHNSSYTTICRYQLDQVSDSTSLLWWLIPAFTWNLFPTECVDKEKNIFILGTSTIVYIIYTIVVLICAYIPLFFFALPNVSKETYSCYFPGDQPFSIKRLAIKTFHIKERPPCVKRLIANITENHSNKLVSNRYKRAMHVVLQTFFTPTGRMSLLFIICMNSVTYFKKFLHHRFNASEAELYDEAGNSEFEFSIVSMLLVFCLSVLFIILLSMQFCFYSEAVFDQSSILLLDVHEGVVRVTLPLSLSPVLPNNDYEQNPRGKVPTAILKTLVYCFTPEFWKLVLCVPFRRVFTKKISGWKSTLKAGGLVIFGFFLLSFNFAFHALSTFVPILKFPIFGTMDMVFNMQKRRRPCRKIVQICIWHIFMFCYYLIVARELLFTPFLLIIEFISYTLFIGVPFYPEYAVPRVALVLALIGYLLKFWYNFQSGYTQILQFALKMKKELEQKNSVTVVQFDEICRKVYPFYLSFGLFLGKVLLTALFLSLALISLYESGSFKKYANFGELLSAVLFVFAPGFIDAFFQKDKAIWEHKMEVLVRTVFESEGTLQDSLDVNEDALFCEWECCSGDCVLFCCPCSIKIPLCQQYAHKYVYKHREPFGCNTNFVRCSRYLYKEIDETKSVRNTKEMVPLKTSTNRNTAIYETTPLLPGNKSTQEL